jgi:hypothetical protein
MTATGLSSFGLPEYSYTVKKFAPPCILAKGKQALVGLQPQYTDGLRWNYVSDAEDIPSPHHYGWKNVPDQTFVEVACGPRRWIPAGEAGGLCGGLGCDVFSIALTGRDAVHELLSDHPTRRMTTMSKMFLAIPLLAPAITAHESH